MNVQDLIDARDVYIRGWVYTEFRNYLRDAHMEDGDRKAYELAQNAFEKGRTGWGRAQAKKFDRALRDTNLPDTNG